ncbi:aminofutalosine synthase MqnE [Dissulfurirhabdus thermomarina]|uniref:Aminodeoxyfutalosine synthase n=1 Tax=Dissulfurirhabdus thermomarina TaxID=1765737 RepID=A0A6N9TXK3_DISTH|nr:aminofutalosine synthase MqnE [Dissulfurirhabdus thermomarina]NDY43196.1 aminofutalosine synthase MqnE [Dissulfurirhabdus thermomarina]NMX23355.1 aminofutalosine synthase MqnE [Dissulfurirhabdus thermomarina]
MLQALKKADLFGIYEKVQAGARLDAGDAERLYATPHLPLLGFLANIVRERLNGDAAYYIYNQHINYSNVCVNLCRFCAFGKPKDDPAAYQMDLDEIAAKVRERRDEPVREIHIVGGCHPDLPYDYYLDLLRTVKAERPGVHIQAFTCVEIAHMADLAGKSIEAVLEDLKAAGLGSIPGGGAEVFSPRVRERLCPDKLPGKDWIAVAKAAHRLGLKSNATMLYGHIETVRERIEHLLALREAQDETGGFLCFIPLAFHPKNTDLADLSRTGGVEDLRNIAVARLVLDNIPHIKAYWVMLGPKVAQIALSFGADDLDGTVLEERITHMAGAETEQAMARTEMERLIRAAGREPVERDTLYERVA